MEKLGLNYPEKNFGGWARFGGGLWPPAWPQHRTATVLYIKCLQQVYNIWPCWRIGQLVRWTVVQ